MIITDDGTVIRISAGEIPVYGRGASGVIVMRPDENSSIINFTNVGREDDSQKEGEQIQTSKSGSSGQDFPAADDFADGMADASDDTSDDTAEDGGESDEGEYTDFSEESTGDEN